MPRQLTGSVTFGSFGGPRRRQKCASNSPLIDTTQLKAFSQEVRLASDGGGAFEWLVGAFYQDIDREYGQNLPTPGYDAFLTRVGLPPSAGFNAPPDTPYFSEGAVRRSSSSRCSAKAPSTSPTSGA